MPQAEAPWIKMPLSLLREPDITAADIKVYCTLDFLACRRGWWYGPQEAISSIGVSSHGVCRAVRKLRDKGYIITERLGGQQGTVLKYTICARTQSKGDRVDDLVNCTLPNKATPTAEEDNCALPKKTIASNNTDLTIDNNNKLLTPREQGEQALKDKEWVATLRSLYPDIDWDWNVLLWLNDIEDGRVKRNYKNALGHWMRLAATKYNHGPSLVQSMRLEPEIKYLDIEQDKKRMEHEAQIAKEWFGGRDSDT